MEKTFVRTVNEFFGRKPGQNLSEFQAEIKALTAEDRAYFIREFAKIGWVVAG